MASSLEITTEPYTTQAKQQGLDAPYESQYLCVPQAFTIQVAATPNAVALSDDKSSLSYCELDQRANHLASRLRSLGVGPEIIIGLYLTRSIAMIVGALAILKAGGAYVPLDGHYVAATGAITIDQGTPPVPFPGFVPPTPASATLLTNAPFVSFNPKDFARSWFRS